MDSKGKKTTVTKEKPTKEPKERRKKAAPPRVIEIKYYLDYPEEEREKLFTVAFDDFK
jgi:hypothetical protein